MYGLGLFFRYTCCNVQCSAHFCLYSGTSDKGPSEIGTTSLQGTKLLAPKCPLFGGSTVLHALTFPSGLMVTTMYVDGSLSMIQFSESARILGTGSCHMTVM